ncbi:MAG: hypothetical protein WC551_12595 [Patescibacteria group bacterium]
MGSSIWRRMLCKLGLHVWWYVACGLASACLPEVKRGCWHCGMVQIWNERPDISKWESSNAAGQPRLARKEKTDDTML